MLTIRDPIHGFIRADRLERALINSRPVQRLRHVRQLGFTSLVFPGAEHSRFSHALGAMELAGRVYDALAAKAPQLLAGGPDSYQRRRLRAAALLHDIGHAPYSHSAEELFDKGLTHEDMTRRLLRGRELEEIFATHGEGLTAADVERLLSAPQGAGERLLAEIISGELDVDKMDYLLRDSLFCGVRYGTYDLERLLDTMVPLEDPEIGGWRLGVEEGGVHALEALVLARYYMFTQVYFNVTGKALELHFSKWLEEEGVRWPADPELFLEEDDISVLERMRRSRSQHARAVVDRDYFPLAFQTREHLSPAERLRFRELLPRLAERFGERNLLISNSAKDPHRLGKNRVWVRQYDGGLELMEQASQFIRHLTRIDRYRIYTPEELRGPVAQATEELWR